MRKLLLAIVFVSFGGVAFGQSYTVKEKKKGSKWVEAEGKIINGKGYIIVATDDVVADSEKTSERKAVGWQTTATIIATSKNDSITGVVILEDVNVRIKVVKKDSTYEYKAVRD